MWETVQLLVDRRVLIYCSFPVLRRHNKSLGFGNIDPDYLKTTFFVPGSCQCYCPRRWPELWLRLEQRHPPSGRRGRSLHQAGWWKSPRRKQQQVQHFLGLHPLCRLRTGRHKESGRKENIGQQGVGGMCLKLECFLVFLSLLHHGHLCFISARQTIQAPLPSLDVKLLRTDWEEPGRKHRRNGTIIAPESLPVSPLLSCSIAQKY